MPGARQAMAILRTGLADQGIIPLENITTCRSDLLLALAHAQAVI
jgi:hypothetical protein